MTDSEMDKVTAGNAFDASGEKVHDNLSGPVASGVLPGVGNITAGTTPHFPH